MALKALYSAQTMSAEVLAGGGRRTRLRWGVRLRERWSLRLIRLPSVRRRNQRRQPSEGAGSPKCKVLPAHEPVLVEHWQNGGSVVWKEPMESLGVLGIVKPAEGGGAPLAIVGDQAVKGLDKRRLKILGGVRD